MQAKDQWGCGGASVALHTKRVGGYGGSVGQH